jgi:hypothetical protein
MFRSRVHRLAALLLAVFFFLPSARPMYAQEVEDSKSAFPASVEGLYRIAQPDSIAVGGVRYLRLLPNGMGRVEVVRVRDTAGRLTTQVELSALDSVWYTKARTKSASPQLCLRLDGEVRCRWARREMPRGDLMLYDDGDEMDSPTLVLTRYGPATTAR